MTDRLTEEWRSERAEFHVAFVNFLDAYEDFDGNDRSQSAWKHLNKAFEDVEGCLASLEFIRGGFELSSDGRNLLVPNDLTS